MVRRCDVQIIRLNTVFTADYSSIIIDLFNVIVFIRAINHVITMLCHLTKKLWMAKTFPVPLIQIDSSQLLLG